jgi:dihydrolipoamide dehydrogenase
VLVAVGRVPNGRLLGAEAAGVTVERARLHPRRQADAHQRAGHLRHRRHRRPAHARPQGDARGQGGGRGGRGPEGFFDARVIPSVAYTDPEVAWVGVTEDRGQGARASRSAKGMFPWAASGRALSHGRDEGFTKLMFDPDTHRVIGGGIVGPNAGELIAEIASRSRWAPTPPTSA